MPARARFRLDDDEDVARTWLSIPFFLARGFAVLLVLGFAISFLRRGLAEDDGPEARARFGKTSASQRHDLGKLLFAFGMFWAYIWFCQYLLVWYANLPEEIPHYIARLHRGWAPVFWLNPVLSFAVPFAALLSQKSKRSGVVLGQVAAVVLLGRWIDVWLLVAPAFGPIPIFPVHAVAADEELQPSPAPSGGAPGGRRLSGAL